MESRIAHPAIVVAAWNRPQALRRLLDSLARGHFPAETTLHISIDHFEYDAVAQLAEGFAWPFGHKVVEQHPQRLGLRQHLLHCGGLSEEYGAIILLEDDLAVSPWMYDYAQQAMEFFAEDQAIAGISLYKYAVAESCHQPFEPWQDAVDNWFLQLPSSWGAAFTAAQWQGFMTWLAANFQQLPTLPAYIDNWSAQSWKKLMAAYLIATGKYFAFPRFSLSTNFEDYGAHATTRGLFQVPLLMGKRAWRFGKIADSLAVYDAHFEPLATNLKRICPALATYDFAVDLLGQKSKSFLDRPWVLTRRRGGEAALAFAATAIPLELNLQIQSSGDQLRLVRSDVGLVDLGPLDLEFNYYRGPAKSAVLHLPERRMPAVSVIISAAVFHLLRASLESILSQDYLGQEIVVVVKPGQIAVPVWEAYQAGLLRLVEQQGDDFEGIRQGVAASSGQVILIVTELVQLRAGVLADVAKIFLQFPGLDWMSGIPFSETKAVLSARMALYRWDTDRFAEANADQLRRYLPSCLQAFRRVLWIKAGTETSTLEAHFQAMAQIVLPQVAALEMAEGFAFPKPDMESFWGQRMGNRTRKYYHRHVPILWKGHRFKSDYRPVLRYDATHDTWFEFDY